MGYKGLYSQSYEEIKKLFSSGINIKTLLYLNNNPGNNSDHDFKPTGKRVKEISSGIGYEYSPVSKKVKILDKSGFICKHENRYSLTTSGRILSYNISQIITDYYKNVVIKENIKPDNNDEINIDNIHTHLNGSKIFDDTFNEIKKIFNSEYTLKILFLLKNGQIDRDKLKENVGICHSNTATFTKKIQWLQSREIIVRQDNKYKLNAGFEGKTELIEEIMKINSFIIKHGNYLKSHNISSLPKFSLENIGVLFNSEYTSVRPDNQYSNYNTRLKIINKAKYLNSLFNYPNPDIFSNLEEKINAGYEINAIISGHSASGIVDDSSAEDIYDLNRYNNFNLMVSELPNTFTMTVTDKTLIIRFSSITDGSLDTSRGLLATSEEARDWGKKLYEHYQKDAIPICDYINYKNSGYEQTIP